jgi:hypothetical protein
MSSITPDLLLHLKSQNFDVVTMGHAYRVNGCVDIWFNGKTVFDKQANDYLNFETPQESIARAIQLATNYGKQQAFSLTTARKRMSYQEFKHRKEEINPVAEYYHWNNDKDFSEDCLYFIQSGINVKIGRSIDPKKRLKELSTGIAEKPKILLVVKNKGHMERKLHLYFSLWRIRKDAEWFQLSDQILKFINFLKLDKRKTKIL